MAVSGIKYTKKDVIFATYSKEGKIAWLEIGDSRSGLSHIELRHGKDFNKSLDIPEYKIGRLLYNLLHKSNRLISEDDKNGGTRYTFEYNDSYNVVIVVASNGYIVTAYPLKKGKR